MYIQDGGAGQGADRSFDVKVRLTRNIAGDKDLEVLGRACAAAREAGVQRILTVGLDEASATRTRVVHGGLEHAL